MDVQINRVHFPVTTLGWGRRVGIWLQGCSIQCAGCVSRDTWDPAPARAIRTNDLIGSLGPWLAEADGVTFSGGEPFDQPSALAELLGHLDPYRHRLDILVFSGYERQVLERDHPSVLSRIDALVTGPYDPRAGAALPLRGSDNQELIRFTDLARHRYPPELDAPGSDGDRTLDTWFDGRDLWMAGITRRGDLPRITRRLEARGFDSSHSQDSGGAT